MKTISVLESIIAAPIFWMAATLLRTLLHNPNGVVSYLVLVIPALVIHVLVVRMFVTPRLNEDKTLL